MIDLRSDTFTKPTPLMLEAMFKASVGDDVFGEDPTINALENKAAQLFGMESALFCPSGTMTNQIAIKCHTEPGNEIICDKTSHIYVYEGGGIAFNSGCQVRTIDGNRGKLTADQIVEVINPEDIHKPITKLVSIENTSNRGGGSCYELEDLIEIKKICIENQLNLHLDGARLWNAMVHKKYAAHDFGKIFDSISVCLSKGLGAPVGSLLIANSTFIKKARRVRKLMGGGMRQAGYLAAAGIYALDNHINRLEEDHLHAQKIGSVLAQKDFVGEIIPIETNIIIFEVKGKYSPQTFTEFLKLKNILCIAISSTQVRMVFHLDVTSNMIDEMITTIEEM